MHPFLGFRIIVVYHHIEPVDVVEQFVGQSFGRVTNVFSGGDSCREVVLFAAFPALFGKFFHQQKVALSRSVAAHRVFPVVVHPGEFVPPHHTPYLVDKTLAGSRGSDHFGVILVPSVEADHYVHTQFAGPAGELFQLFFIAHPGNARGVDGCESVAGYVQTLEGVIRDFRNIPVGGYIPDDPEIPVFGGFVLLVILGLGRQEKTESEKEREQVFHEDIICFSVLSVRPGRRLLSAMSRRRYPGSLPRT